MASTNCCYILLILTLFVVVIRGQKRQFTIDYENNAFIKDGRPFRYIAGSLHYFRVPHQYWRDRMLKYKAAGLNAISTYVPWNFHEPVPGIYTFEDDANLQRFLALAKEMDLLVILRPGPYICAEWEFGGLPWWLLKIHDILLRTSDSRYLAAVDSWFSVLFPKIVPFLYKNGGPIILIQVENEYGSDETCDIQYSTYLRDLMRSYVGYDTQLITTDGGSLWYLKCGYIPDVYPTVDFGAGFNKTQVDQAFAAQKTYAPRGPAVNSEYYPGWLDHWGKAWVSVDTNSVISTMDYMNAWNASYIFFVFHGGTNFGYWSGTSKNPTTTSYDYDAPLTEAGDPTPKYYAIRNKVARMRGIDLRTLPVPQPTSKAAYGAVKMRNVGTIFNLLHKVAPPELQIRSRFPKRAEDMNQPYGYIMYETIVPFDVRGGLLNGTGVKDRGFVFVDGVPQGHFIHKFHQQANRQMRISGRKGQKLQILTENLGRSNYGYLYDPKGIVLNVTLENTILQGWLCNFPLFDTILNDVHTYQGVGEHSELFVPSVYTGEFHVDVAKDTFFDPTNWGKGQVFINGYNLGRYWPSAGPQVTLYVPKWYLRQGRNSVTLFETETSFCAAQQYCQVKFVEQPLLNGPFNTIL